jgi:protein-S-isoprenylcysteine O-methyltransferase Ste14
MPITIASLAVGIAFFALWFWLLPYWLNFRIDTAAVARWRWIAGLPSVLGFAVALRCVWDFGRTGHGTPSPLIPPKKLVVVGFYRYVRNPMYLGFVTGWIGLWMSSGKQTLPPSSWPSWSWWGSPCSLCFTRSLPYAASSVPSTKYIAGMCRAGYHV